VRFRQPRIRDACASARARRAVVDRRGNIRDGARVARDVDARCVDRDGVDRARGARGQTASCRAGPSTAMRAGAQIFFASVRAILEVVLRRRRRRPWARAEGWLDRKTCKTLSTFNGNFFLPALLWVVPEPLGERERAAKAVVTAGDVRRARDARDWRSGWASCAGLRVKPGFRTVALMSSGFGNSLALPVVVARAIIKNPRIGKFDVHER
jgi:hypothetical protein